MNITKVMFSVIGGLMGFLLSTFISIFGLLLLPISAIPFLIGFVLLSIVVGSLLGWYEAKNIYEWLQE